MIWTAVIKFSFFGAIFGLLRIPSIIYYCADKHEKTPSHVIGQLLGQLTGTFFDGVAAYYIARLLYHLAC